jgi:hypothetical protein
MKKNERVLNGFLEVKEIERQFLLLIVRRRNEDPKVLMCKNSVTLEERERIRQINSVKCKNNK